MTSPEITLRPDGRQPVPVQRSLEAIYEALTIAIRASATQHAVQIAKPDVQRMAADLTPIVIRVPFSNLACVTSKRDKSRIILRPREQQALMGLARGLSAKQTAYRLGISEDTVKTHLRRAYAALGARNGSNAVAICLKYGLLTAEDIDDV